MEVDPVPTAKALVRLVPTALVLISEFLDNRSLINFYCSSQKVCQFIGCELEFRREIWVDSRPHGGSR